MNKLFLVCGLVLTGIATTSQTENSTTDFENQVAVESVSLTVNEHTLFWSADNEEITLGGAVSFMPTKAPEYLDLNQISYLEVDEEIELGFDTKAYLPENFDPTAFYFDVTTVTYIDESKGSDLGYNTKEYLPNNFDAYSEPQDAMDVSYIEATDDALGFDTALYLPKNFDAYETELDLNTIVYIEEDIDFELYLDSIDF